MMTPFFNPALHKPSVLMPVTDGIWSWFDASDESTVLLTPGDETRCYTWNDKSSARRSAIASSTARPYYGSRTQNGLKVLDFQGAQALTFLDNENPASGGNATVMGVMKPDSASGIYALYHGSRPDSTNEADGIWVMSNINSGGALIASCCNVNAATQSRVGSSGSTDAAIFGMVRNGAVQNAIYNNSLGGDAVAQDATPVGPALFGRRHHIGQGGANWLDGFIAEVLMYDRALTAGEMTQNLAYLNAKWGL